MMNMESLLASVNSATAAQGSPASTGATQTSANQLTGDSFITLLVAQLQGQDPLNPMDPTQFVTQLVQFNQLEQLIQINQALKPSAGSATTGAPASVPAKQS